MTGPPDVERPGEAAATPGRESDSPSGRIGSNPSTESAAPLYFVVDKRRDGRMRIIGEYREPRAALEHARMLAWAGDAAEVLVAATYRPDGG